MGGNKGMFRITVFSEAQNGTRLVSFRLNNLTVSVVPDFAENNVEALDLAKALLDLVETPKKDS